MLVLSRKEGERIVIGGNVVVTIVRVGNDRARIGVEAPSELPVHREEVFRRIHASTKGCVPGIAIQESRFHSEFA